MGLVDYLQIVHLPQDLKDPPSSSYLTRHRDSARSARARFLRLAMRRLQTAPPVACQVLPYDF